MKMKNYDQFLNENKNMNTIFKIIQDSIYTNGTPKIEARNLTINDFNVKENEKPKDEVIEPILNGDIKRGHFQWSITLTLKDEIIKEIEKESFILSPDYHNKSILDLKNAKEYISAYRYIDVSTGTNRLRNKDSIREKINEKYKIFQERIKNEKGKLIQEIIDIFNLKLQNYVKRNNQNFERQSLSIFSNDTIKWIESDDYDDDEIIKKEYIDEKSKLNIEIEELEEKLEILRKKQKQNKIDIIEKVFKEEIDKLPKDIKEKLNKQKDTAFNKRKF
jgi:hypothetical protein